METIEVQEQIATAAAEAIVTLTPAAARQVAYLMKRKGDETLWLRLGVKGGGCSGLSYLLRLEQAPAAHDLTYVSEGVRIAVDPKSARYLKGSVLDFSVSNLLEGGWVWSNPNSVRDCGCGTSFSPKR